MCKYMYKKMSILNYKIKKKVSKTKWSTSCFNFVLMTQINSELLLLMTQIIIQSVWFLITQTSILKILIYRTKAVQIIAKLKPFYQNLFWPFTYQYSHAFQISGEVILTAIGIKWYWLHSVHYKSNQPFTM
jgi:hypothetical protein